MNESGATGCFDCTPGYYCIEGSSAPLPCPAGTHKNASLDVMTDPSQCVTCQAGTWCSVGSAAATPCAAGTVNPEARQSACAQCIPGKYQHVQGETACFGCTAGNYCPAGSSAELPCPGGRYSSAGGFPAEGRFCAPCRIS